MFLDKLIETLSMQILFAPDIPNIFTAIAEWLSCVVFVFITKKQNPNFKLWQKIGISVCFLFLLCLWHQFAIVFPKYLFILRIFVGFSIMVAFIKTMCHLSMQVVVYYALSCFMVAEFSAAFEWQINYYIVGVLPNTIVANILCVAIVYVVIFSISVLAEFRYRNVIQNTITRKDVLLLTVLTLSVFGVSNLSFIFPDTPFSSMNETEIFYIRSLVDFCGVAFMYFQREYHYTTIARMELKAMHSVMDNHYQQYCNSKESIDILNKRIHDFKHQIFIIKEEADKTKRDKYFNQIEIDLKKATNSIETGFKVLDTILQTKNSICIEKNIVFTIVADGLLIQNMDVMHVCSLFGNALDNAIESVDKIEDADKKLIKLALFSQDQFIMIKVANCYEQKLSIDSQGQFKTTKRNSELHGYGIKSIKSVAKSYGGTVTINTKDGWFSLLILLPKQKFFN